MRHPHSRDSLLSMFSGRDDLEPKGNRAGKEQGRWDSPLNETILQWHSGGTSVNVN
jgi:hypothetical protein